MVIAIWGRAVVGRIATAASRRSGLSLALLGFLAAVPGPVVAQPAPAAGKDEATVLHLSEHAERTLKRDRLRVELRVDATDADARRLQDEINQRMAAAVARAKPVPDITVQTTGYNLYQERADKEPPRWHGSEGLLLAGRDFGALLALAGALQEQGLVLSSLTPELSRDAAQAVEGELTDEALRRLRLRATRIAATLNSTIERYSDLRVGGVAAPPVPRTMALAAGMAAPVAEPGEAPISVTVDADVVLAPVRR